MRNSSYRRKGISGFAAVILVLIAALIAGAGVYAWQNPQVLGGTAQAKQDLSKSTREIVQSRADEILHALKDGDMQKLAAFVHPDKGVRFSPYASVNIKNDIVIDAGKISGLMTDTSKKTWGVFDGSGKPIDLTFEQYYKKFVYDVNFLEAPQIVFNEVLKRGNSINNVKDAYPKAVFMEYYYSGFDKKFAGMDWRSLRLVFEEKDNIWYLVGIIHDQWTI